MLDVVYDPFLTRKTTISEKISFMTPFFTLFVLSRASDNTTSLNIGGTDAWVVPHLKFFGDRPPRTPRSPPLPPSSFDQNGYRMLGKVQTDPKRVKCCSYFRSDSRHRENTK